MRPDGLVELSQAAQRSDDIEPVTVAEDTDHGDGSGELLEVFGGRVVGHLVECDGRLLVRGRVPCDAGNSECRGGARLTSKGA